MIFGDKNEPVMLQGAQDKDEAKKYTVYFRPETWQPNNVYYDKKSIVVPTVFNGYAYIAVSGGISLATEPAFPCRKGETVEDGCVLWKAVPYDFILSDGQVISSVLWTSDTSGVVIDHITFSQEKTSAIVHSIPDGTESVTINIHTTISGTTETINRSFIIPVAVL